MAEHDLNKIVDDEGEVFNLRDNTKQPTSDRVTRWSSTTSDTKYPSEKLVKDSLDTIPFNADFQFSTASGTNDKCCIVKLSKPVNAYNGNNGTTVGVYILDLFNYRSSVGPEYQSKVQLMIKITDGASTNSRAIALDGFSGKYLPIDGFSLHVKTAVNGIVDIYLVYTTNTNYVTCVGKFRRLWDVNYFTETWYKSSTSFTAFDASGDNVATDVIKDNILTKLTGFVGGTLAFSDGKPVINTSVLGTVPVENGGTGNTSVDTAPTANSTKMVTSGGIFNALNDKATKIEFTQPAEYKSFVIIEDVTRWYDPAGTASLSKGYQLIGQIAYWRTGGGYESMAVAFIKFHLNYRWQLNNDSCCEVKSTLPNNSFCPMIIKDARDENNVKYYFGLRTKIAWNSTVQFIGRTRDLSFSNLEWIPGENAAHTGNGTEFPVGITIERNCDLLEWNSIANGGTGATTAIGAEYNILDQVADIDTTLDGNRKIALCNQTKSASNGVFRWIKLSNVWTYIKGQISSVLGLSESNGVKTFTGNAATATKATQDSDGNAINATYFKSSGNTTLVAGAATKIGTQNGADVKLTLPAHQDISGKMNTSASNATAPSSSGGDGATATLLNNLSDGNGDIVTTDDGDNVLIATTDNGGTVTNKWYKRKLVKLIPWIIKKLGTRLVYDCGAGSTSGDDFDAALAAFNAGQWVIIHDSNNVYYCAGTYNSGLRFKRLTNSASGISVNTLNWTRGSSPSAGSQLDASLSGHTHTRSDVTNFAHTHGNIQDGGALQTSDVAIASGDKLVVTDSSDSGKVARASASFDGSTTTKALTQKGTFETFMTPSASNAASGALQNLTAQLSEGTSDFTDNTEIYTSYAGNNGFAESGHVNQPYRRKASSMLNYVRDYYAIDRSPANVGTSHKRITLGYGKYNANNYVGAATYLVRLFFNYADNGGLQGKGITVLVTYDFRRAGTQKAECRILSDNGVRDAGYNVVLANYLSGSGDDMRLYISVGLVKNTAPTTLVEYNYSYCKIFRLCTIGDWGQSISSDANGTYDFIVPATDLVSSAVNADMVDGKHIVIGSWAGASDTIYFG